MKTCSNRACDTTIKDKDYYCSEHNYYSPIPASYSLPEYRIYVNMKIRCYDKNNPTYKFYGAKGVKVCEAWLVNGGYINFLKDMGVRPSIDHSLDRIDPSGDYEPSNCRWIMKSLQFYNKRPNPYPQGVSFDKHRKLWVASMTVNSKKVLYGLYPTLEFAIEARKHAETVWFG